MFLLYKVTHILQKYCKSSNFIPLQRQEMTFSYLLHQINAEICTEKWRIMITFGAEFAKMAEQKHEKPSILKKITSKITLAETICQN